MTESTQDKTKRKYLHLLTNYNWSYQCSIFYQSPNDSICLLDDMKSFKQNLRRNLDHLPFLIRVCMLNRLGELQAYLSIHTTENIKDETTVIAIGAFSEPVNVIGRRRSDISIASAAASIGKQKPHNLNRFFDKPKINRYSLLNGHLLEQHRKVTA